MWLIFLCILQLLYTWNCEALTVKALVPRYKIRGETAVLRCDFELEGDLLYAVKWYRENEEFYRFVPKATPQKTSYIVDGIKVDHAQSNSRQLTLKDITLKTTANYRCEVSAEGPSFASAQDGGRMEVIYLPKDGPYISGDKTVYQFGDSINLNCTSAKSYPASTLHWFVNNIPAKEESLKRYSPQIHPRGLVTTTLGIRLSLDAETVLNGAVRVRCVAILSPVLWSGDNEKVLSRQDKREALLLVTGSSSKCHYSLTVVFLFIIIIMSLFM
ncbi:uncharacterized protein LOC126902947 [Daktulosphaira vitifoliae]|uniref:uncharacterized protein LOC126902947 n=1 Tax=Daktulosphaira vitifoliae TaxID=58002 RepID=UPI0021AAEC6F|nr:uncharacterized protein LOC126902947 [Daktulosphaira vitifoliae]XP_050536710.1 uncharacterized protein LOC126902947 [Daktulosphaira vitifoliae]XP_050536711.1 uncharacterized protein LOC126902947 [Daktulosphaira vitifoliae]XP_050536712.1 uncharacterized protein LOC126902947 [Daktulosphaira vitifoliae]XP_050536713.1 uncharacterized protein LOC126902947 [Daktulosphaira vitifoliae]